MENVTKAFKEWNAVIEALGAGKQTVLMRTYSTSIKEFLLYPTVLYSNKKNYLTKFKKRDQQFVEKHAIPQKKDDQIEIKYYAIIEEIIEMDNSRIGSVDYLHIWSGKHVKSYLNKRNGFIWVIRVYRLKKSIFANKNMGMLFANLKKGASLEGMEPVLSDKDFEDILSHIWVFR